MKCLLVSAHPLSDSLCHRLSLHVADVLTQQGHELVHENLYADGFDPVLSAAERQSYYAAPYDSSAIDEQVKHLTEADALVLVFPTWWFSFPAILKGWFDRVWGPGIAYDHATDLGAIKPRLDKLKRVMVITSLGSPWWVDRLLLRQPVKKVMKLALLTSCARNSRLQFLSLYDSEKLDDNKIVAFTHKIDHNLKKWAE